MKAYSMQKSLVFVAVLAAVVSACSCYSAEDEYDVTYFDEADGYDASYFPEEADAGSASSEASDTYSSTGQSSDEDGYDEDAYEEEAPVLRAPVVRQLKKLVPGQRGGVNQKKCNDECAKLEDESQRLCCPLWCRYSSDKAKGSKAKGRDATSIKEASWKSVNKLRQGNDGISTNLFIKFTKSPKCLDFLKENANKPQAWKSARPTPKWKSASPTANMPRLSARRNASPKRRSTSPARD